MRHVAYLAVLIGLLVAFLASPSVAAGPTFTNGDGYQLEIHELQTQSDFVFIGKKLKREFSVDFEAAIRVPSSLDLVCISDELTMASAVDERGKEQQSQKARRSTQSINKVDFSAILTESATTELKDAELSANPYTVKTMTVEAKGVIGKKRVEVTIPAEVVEDLNDIGNGIHLRLSAMRIDSKRVVQLTIEYKRPAGINGTILESVYLLNAKGESLGGGRWSRGLSIFAPSMQYKGKYQLGAGASVAKIKCVLLTDYEVKPIQFEVTSVFQK